MFLPAVKRSDDPVTDIILPELVDASIQKFDRLRFMRRNKVMKLPDHMSPTEWVSKNVRLEGNLSENEGYLEYSGFQRALSDAFMDPDCNEITVLKGTRIGWSLFIASLAAYIVGYLGKTITIAQPTEQDAEDFAKEVIEPMIQCCDVLRETRIPGAMLLIQFTNGGLIRLVGATSDDSFRRYDSQFNFADEGSAAGYAPKKGSQGDKFSLFKERGGAHYHTVLGVGSSPLSKEECRTYARYMTSDKRSAIVTCPHCGTPQTMEWGEKDVFGFQWTCDEVTGFVDDAYYMCKSPNKCRITDNDKYLLDQSMEFPPTDIPTTPGHYGFHVPQWLSFAGQASYKKICQRFVSSQGDPEKLKTFTNNVRAWVWDEYTTSAMEPKVLHAMLRPYAAEVPDDVVLLTAGGDTQDNKEGSHLEQVQSRELQVVGWNRHGQFRVIGHWKIFGEPGEPSSDNELKELLNRTFYKRDGTPLRIMAAAIDLGSNTRGVADATRIFCNRFPLSRNIWAIKGNAHRKDFIWPKRKTPNKNSGVFYSIDSHLARDQIFKKLQYQGDAAPMVPSTLGEAFIDKLVCQERYRKEGRWHWRDKKSGRAEEEWMCLAYAYAALMGLAMNYPKRWQHLNLAADAMGIPQDNRDPGTGEMYAGVDKSAPAAERLTQTSTMGVADTHAAPTVRVSEQKVNDVPAPVPQPPVKKKIKRFKAGRVG